MRKIIKAAALILLFGCSIPPQYTWQDTRQPAREDASADINECRSFAAKQYSPGVPAGEAYQKSSSHDLQDETGGQPGEWRPDRTPFPVVNQNSQPVHDIPTDYTGYPGELDYYPHYLDDIFEKCMHDKGWSYRPEPVEE